ncbi:unnamed protein product [Ectocarpus sp. CCAP 1310/34]|nr:unnamed protein product [Ectocarpus sp. CCAP 1310/34]
MPRPSVRATCFLAAVSMNQPQGVISWGASLKAASSRHGAGSIPCTTSSTTCLGGGVWNVAAPSERRRRLSRLKAGGVGSDVGVGSDMELGEGEELLGTVDVSPEEVAEFFAKPTFEAVDASQAQPAPSVDTQGSSPEHVLVMDSFLAGETASRLRGVFHDRFSKPREGSPERFVWDWWHVPDQYTLMRTPAENYFGPEGFTELLKALTNFGQERLGCTAISPPWLSVYVDGCEQRYHTDSWHGPWAFVLSLTDWENRGFTGGETMILKPHVLDYWRSFQPGIGLEEKHFIDTVEPHFNRLTVFDPRFPHGVRPVGGTKDPLKGRLVIHGWFTDPQPFFTGGLSAEEATEPLNDALETVYPALEGVGRVTGVLTVRLHVSGETGAVVSVVALTDTLIPDPNDVGVDEEGVEEDARADVLEAVDRGCREARFPAAGEDTHITVPFVFE